MRALVLSGGGANGAFQAGVLAYIVGRRKVHYDIVAGVSVGALNGSILAQYAKGLEDAFVDQLVAEWDRIGSNSEIYRKWYWGMVPYPLPFLLKWKHSVFQTRPLRDHVVRTLDLEKLRTSGRKFVCGAVEWGDGSRYRLWDQDSPHIAKAVLASSAYPVFFEPIEIEGKWYTDGGLRDVAPIKAAIDLGATRIDIIQAGSARLSVGEPKPEGLDQVQRAINIILDEVVDNDYRMAQMINHTVREGCAPDPKYRVVELRRLKSDIDLGDSLDFSRTKNRRLWNLGTTAARAHDSLWG